MKIGVYGDVHLNKNMRDLQPIWEVTANKSLFYMYEKFDEECVKMAVCLGDFLDTPRLEAKDISLILPILNHINSRSYPTYILLGNHEIYDDESNILEYLTVYENIHPVTDFLVMENMVFIPYNIDLGYIESIDYSMLTDRIIFTHRDIYGSSLASDKSKAFFGTDPSFFENAKLVMNGHVHLKSKVSDNILNAGSLLVSSQGELRLGEFPSYYIVDTGTAEYKSIDNVYSMFYISLDEDELTNLESCNYDYAHTVIRIEYEDTIRKEGLPPVAKINWRKKITDISGTGSMQSYQSNFDLKTYILSYIDKDSSLSDEVKELFKSCAVEMLS